MAAGFGSHRRGSSLEATGVFQSEGQGQEVQGEEEAAIPSHPPRRSLAQEMIISEARFPERTTPVLSSVAGDQQDVTISD